MATHPSPSVFFAVRRMLKWYLISLLVTLGVAIVFAVLSLALAGVIFLCSHFVTITLASYKATKAYDACFETGEKRARGLILVAAYALTLAVPIMGLPSLLALFMPDTMAGGYLAIVLLMLGLGGGPIVIWTSASVGVFVAR